MSLNVCIFGVSGYTGSKLLEYLCKHKNVKILGVFGKKSKGIGLEKLFPNIDNLPKIKILVVYLMESFKILLLII